MTSRQAHAQAQTKSPCLQTHVCSLSPFQVDVLWFPFPFYGTLSRRQVLTMATRTMWLQESFRKGIHIPVNYSWSYCEIAIVLILMSELMSSVGLSQSNDWQRSIAAKYRSMEVCPLKLAEVGSTLSISLSPRGTIILVLLRHGLSGFPNRRRCRASTKHRQPLQLLGASSGQAR